MALVRSWIASTDRPFSTYWNPRAKNSSAVVGVFRSSSPSPANAGPGNVAITKTKIAHIALIGSLLQSVRPGEYTLGIASWTRSKYSRTDSNHGNGGTPHSPRTRG